MKKVYYGALALVFGLALTFAVSAFTAAETTTTYWFEVSNNGQSVIDYLGDSEGDIPGICNQSSGDYCVLGFGPEDIEDPEASTPVLKSQVQNNPLMYKNEERHKGN